MTYKITFSNGAVSITEGAVESLHRRLGELQITDMVDSITNILPTDGKWPVMAFISLDLVKGYRPTALLEPTHHVVVGDVQKVRRKGEVKPISRQQLHEMLTE